MKPCCKCKKEVSFLGGYTDKGKRYCRECWKKKESGELEVEGKIWECDYCGEEFCKKEDCGKHEQRCKKERRFSNHTLIKNKKTRERFIIIKSSSLIGCLVGGSYTISNIKTKEIKMITGNKFAKEYEVLG
ncbi:MAG: hypothetical protein KKF50_02245 [Nanoarchaeota archaeon]|nr:hypothetical protein [Nanoarchaeota archaeon]